MLEEPLETFMQGSGIDVSTPGSVDYDDRGYENI